MRTEGTGRMRDQAQGWRKSYWLPKASSPRDGPLKGPHDPAVFLILWDQDSIKVAIPMATDCHWPKAQDSEASTRGFIYVLEVQCQAKSS